jgi:hypothetical protein
MNGIGTHLCPSREYHREPLKHVLLAIHRNGHALRPGLYISTVAPEHVPLVEVNLGRGKPLHVVGNLKTSGP